ncbi:MAG: protoporphyrinogen oxidase HemJ [Alphaproteobacteria bacterium]|nr:protoporphyrinogen oxidase HemJ [Alphaproteobacteria bacterium]
MVQFISDYYLWIKAFHVVFVTCWMAGIFYLPRLFVYHVETNHLETKKTFEIMERKLYRGIMTPSMYLSVLLGSLLLFIPGTLSCGYIHLKILCVLLLIVFHFYLNHCRHQLAQGENTKTSRFFRIINELPLVLLIIIVVCVIVKPF